MTIDEAKTKWCPLSRVTATSAEDGSSWNRFNYPVDETPVPKSGEFCIGSACMVWRSKESRAIVMGEERIYNADSGYCGLAGAQP